MKRLFDTSALLNIIRMLGDASLSYIRNSYTLSLTPYEIGNALWKETMLLRKISLEEAMQLLDAIEFLLRYLYIIEPRNKRLVLEIAHRLKITYYDASYVVSAHELEAELVTDDDVLRRRIEESREVLRKILGREIVLRASKEIA